MKLWNYEIMKLWNYEIMKLWNYEIMKLWKYEIMKLWNYDISKPLPKVNNRPIGENSPNLVAQGPMLWFFKYFRRKI
jgi:hypothetical protein